MDATQQISTPTPRTDSIEDAWFAAYTVVRHEKEVERQLLRRSIETFLPRRQIRRQWKDRKVTVEFPLFPGYVFVRIAYSDRIKILNIRGVVRVLGTNGHPTPIPDEQIESIQKVIASELDYEPVDYFPCGSEVTVTNGPLLGVQGHIITHRGSNRIVISADLIEQAIAVEIDVGDVRLL